MAEWRPVLGREGLYEVSSEGAVRSVPRVLMRSNGIPQTVRGRVLRQYLGNHGYWVVSLRHNNESIPVCVHRLVCEAFHGPRPEGYEVAHNDGCRTNGRADNLRWATRLENIRDKATHGTQPRGEQIYNARLTEDQARQALAAKKGIRALARQFGVHPSTLTSIRIGKSWRHLREAA
jgi:hypothetical protein